jgi:hypothetical protein
MRAERRGDAGYFVSETVRAMRVGALRSAGAVAGLTLLDWLSDVGGDSFRSLNALTLIVTVLFQHEITLAALRLYGFEPQQRRRLWALLGLNIITGLGIMLGLVLLVLPGLYAIVRWSVSVPALIAEEAGVIESISRSGEEIAGRFWPVAGTMLLTWSVIVAGAVFVTAVPADYTSLASALGNLVVNLALVAGWHAAVVIYAAGRQDLRLTGSRIRGGSALRGSTGWRGIWCRR